MAKLFPEIDSKLRAFIEAQHIFFVATAPMDMAGHINLSPKGLADTFRVLDPQTVAYIDYAGSGVETIAHLRENGRITIMFCAFQGPPNIVRLQGQGRVFEPQDVEYAALRPLFPSEPEARAIIQVKLDRISDSCGYAVPRYSYENQRTQLVDWLVHKDSAGLQEYQQRNNSTSIDGLAGLRWTKSRREGIKSE
jgi:hypothetical protein